MAKRTNDPFVKLFGSQARVRLLRLFLFSRQKSFTAAEAMHRSKITASEARREMKTLAESGVIRRIGKKRPRYSVEEKFPYLNELQQMLLSASLRGYDVPGRLRASGSVKLIVLAGIFTGNFDGEGLDMLVVGDRLSERRIKGAMRSLEADIGSELQYATLTTADFLYRLTISDRFIRDIFDYPHRAVLNKLDIGLTHTPRGRKTAEAVQ